MGYEWVTRGLRVGYELVTSGLNVGYVGIFFIFASIRKRLEIQCLQYAVYVMYKFHQNKIKIYI